MRWGVSVFTEEPERTALKTVVQDLSLDTSEEQIGSRDGKKQKQSKEWGRAAAQWTRTRPAMF